MTKNYTFPTLIFVLIAHFLLAQDCGDRYQVNSFDSVVVSTVKFGEAPRANGTNQELFMDIYQPHNDTLDQRPVVIFAFGGSFVGGARTSSELVFMATELAKKGYVCASIDYRLANSLLDLIQEENLIKTVFRAVQDGKAAIRFFRKDAETDNEFKINPDQIYIGGTSAGGILAINLAYADNLSKLPAQWQTWADEIGGIEGNSGNSGYCSYPQGVFGFAGAVADTNYIDASSVPFYGSHSTGDATVRYGYGPPLDNPLVTVPVNLYGSSLIHARLNNLGIYSELDTYNNSDHPPLIANQATLNETNDNLTTFLFNIIECNPDNMLTGSEKNCSSFSLTSVTSVNTDLNAVIYPNPAKGFFNFNASGEKIEQGYIFNAAGMKVKSISAVELENQKVSIDGIAKGIYFVQFTGQNLKTTKKLIIE
jgi:para-nitrobenzyl esterase